MADRNLLQGQHLLNEGLSTRDYLSQAYRSLPQHPGKDLCAILVLNGWIDPLQAERARQHVDFLMLSGSGIVPVVDEDLSQTLSVNQGYRPPLGASSDLLPTVNDTLPSDFQPTVSGVLPGVSEIRSAIVGQEALDKTVLSGEIKPIEASSYDSSADSASAVLSPKGLRRIGDYEILSELSQGGMGAVYIAQNLKLGNKVALKTLLAGKLASAEAISRFKLEAETAARLSHPNIVKVLDVGEHEGHHYLVMELIEGRTLKDSLSDGPLDPKEAAMVIESIARALAYAHRRAVLHRDIKPANILIRDSDGCPLITDFGLAKDFSSEAEKNGLTVTGQFIGTPEYMSPEQANGELQLIDRRADIYSLGASLYETLTGQPPFRSANLANIIHAIMTYEPKPPSEACPQLSADLETIVLKCLEKDPPARYLTMDELADDLHRYLTDQPILARRPKLTERFRRWRLRHKVALQIVLAITLTAAAFLATTVLYPRWQARRERLAREQREAENNARIAKAQKELAQQLDKLVQESTETLQRTASLDARLEAFLFENSAAAPPKDIKAWQSELETSQSFLQSRAEALAQVAAQGPSPEQKNELQKSDRDRALQKALSELNIPHWQAQLLYLSGLIQAVAHRRIEALNTWAKAYSLAPNSRGGSLSYLALADDFLDRNNFAKAKTIYNEVLGHKDPTIQNRARLGWTLVQIADARFDLAKAYIETIDLSTLSPRFQELAKLSLDICQKFAGKEEVATPFQSLYQVLLGNKTILLTSKDGLGYQRYEFGYRDKAIQLDKQKDRLLLPKGKHSYDCFRWPTKKGTIQFLFYQSDGRDLFGRIYLHSWNGQEFIDNNYPPIEASDLERRYGIDFGNVAPTSIGDLDGNGHPELFLTQRWNPVKAQILWNITSSDNRLTRVTTLPTDSQVGGQYFLDYDGDGKDELIVSFTGWKLYGVQIYKGMDWQNFEQQKPQFELLGSCGFPILHHPDRRNAPELLVTASRSQEQDIVSIYGEDLAPEKSDGLYSLRLTKQGYEFKPLFMLPFEKRREQQILLTVSLAAMFPQYPDSFLVRSRENLKGKNDYMAISSGNHRARVVIKPQYSGRLPFTADVDKDGDLELIWTRGSQAEKNKRFMVWGLKDKVKAVSVKSVEGPSLSRREQNPELIALDLLRAGQAKQTLRFVKGALANAPPKSTESIRLLFIKAHALASLGQLREARSLCQKVAQENERWSIKALKQAVLYSEQLQDYQAAVADLRKLQSAFVLDQQMTLDVDRMLARMIPLAQLEPVLELKADRLLNPKSRYEVYHPWTFQLGDGRLHAEFRKLSESVFQMPICHFRGDSLRLKMSFEMKALDLAANADIKVFNKEDPDAVLRAHIRCRGGGDTRSFQRRLQIDFCGATAFYVFFNELGDFHFDPNATIELDILYSQQSGYLQASLKCHEVTWSQYAFLPPQRLTPGLYQLALTHEARGAHNNYLGAATKLAIQKITVEMPKDSVLHNKTIPLLDPLGLAGQHWLLGDDLAALKKLDIALKRNSDALKAPQKTKSLAQLREDDFLAGFLKACVLARLGRVKKSGILFRQFRKKYPERFHSYWVSHFTALPESCQILLSELITEGMTAPQILAKGDQLFNNRSQACLPYFYRCRSQSKGLEKLIQARQLCGDYAQALKEVRPFLHAPQNRRFAAYLYYKLRDYKQAFELWKPFEKDLGSNVDYLIAKKFAQKQ